MLEKKGGAVWLEKYPSLHSSLASELECMKSEQCKITALSLDVCSSGLKPK